MNNRILLLVALLLGCQAEQSNAPGGIDPPAIELNGVIYAVGGSGLNSPPLSTVEGYQP